MKSIILKVSSGVLTLFALLTIFMSGSVIFDLFGIREKEGNYVLFVVISNFICGLLYLVAAYGLFSIKNWTTRILSAATLILILSFIGLLIHINMHGVYEAATIKALLFRISITILFSAISWFGISRANKSHV